MSEFNLIAKYFTRNTKHTDLSVGDDAALIRVAQGRQLAISADMLVAGTHFFHDAPAYSIGWKSLAVNVSDMAAMGALPKWATLAIALPEVNETWLAEFSKGFFACAQAFDIDLIGGDTTKGPLTLSIQIMGEVPTGKAIQRNGAQIGDDVWVSGLIGSAALGLAHLQGKIALTEPTLSYCINALNAPTPRVALGLALRGIANSCIDISDGLTADLSHILKASNLGAKLSLENINCDDYLRTHLNDSNIQQSILAGGDDYELLFTAPKLQRDCIHQLSSQLQLPLSLIGETTPQLDLIITHCQKILNITKKGFDHFG